MKKARIKSITQGLASLTAAITNLVQASELVEDICEDTNYFSAPKSIKILFWVILIFLASQEIEKTRNRFEECISNS